MQGINKHTRVLLRFEPLQFEALLLSRPLCSLLFSANRRPDLRRSVRSATPISDLALRISDKLRSERKMDVDTRRFGSGPRELGGAVDLINRYKLWPHYESFCKRSIPLSISETRYLHNVVGDTEIRKGEGMELDELLQNASYFRGRSTSIDLFDLDTLGDAFRMRETTSVKLPLGEKGVPTSVAKVKNELKEKEKKRKKLKSRDNKQEKDKDRNFCDVSGFEHLRGQWDKKRRLVGGFESLLVSGNQRSLVTERTGQRDSRGNLR